MRSLKLRFGQFETQHHVRILAALIFELVIKPVRDRAEERRRPAPILQPQAERFDFGSASVQRGPHRERGHGGAAAGGEGKEVPMRLRPDPSGSIARFRIFRDATIFVILDHIQGCFARRENVIPTLRYEFDELRRRGISPPSPFQTLAIRLPPARPPLFVVERSVPSFGATRPCCRRYPTAPS